MKLIVDMNTMALLEIEYDSVIAPPAPVMGEYEPDLVPGQTLRTDIKPLEITQPDGPSFEVDGNVVRWQNWEFRLAFNYREGPVIHQVKYDDHGTARDIAYRMSFAEMIVPYRDSSFDHYRRTAYDIGEWGIGYMTQSLALGCDCLGEIRYLDAVLTDSLGEPSTIANAICLHEEDNAVLWKHVDSINGRAEVRRARRMVVSIHATVANYEYLVYWRFYQDGNIECEVRATGIMVTTPLPEGAADAADRDARRPAHLRAVPPAFPGRPAGHGHRRPGQHRHGSRLDGGADRTRRTPTGWRLSPRQRPSPRRRSRAASSTGTPSGPGR